MNSPLVSILIPCRNAAPWLEACLDSAFAQTWPDKEIILVDDGSADGSAEIAARYLPRGLRLIQGPARNASSARNAALRAATGEWIQFLDADDVLAPDKVGLQMEAALAHPEAALLSASWGAFRENPQDAVFHPSLLDRDLSGVEYLQLHWETGAMRQPAAWLARRRLLDSIGPWDETLTLNDDGEYFARAALAAGSILHVGAAKAYHRQGHSGRLSSRRDPAALDSLFRSVAAATDALLKADGSERTRRACAHAWKCAAFELHPENTRRSQQAWQRSRELGGSNRPFPAGPAFEAASAVLGWRMAKRLRHWIHS